MTSGIVCAAGISPSSASQGIASSTDVRGAAREVVAACYGDGQRMFGPAYIGAARRLPPRQELDRKAQRFAPLGETKAREERPLPGLRPELRVERLCLDGETLRRRSDIERLDEDRERTRWRDADSLLR